MLQRIASPAYRLNILYRWSNIRGSRSPRRLAMEGELEGSEPEEWIGGGGFTDLAALEI